MNSQLEAEGFKFEFAKDMIDCIVFDSERHHVPQSHLNPVDIIAEFPDEYVFIELKKFKDGKIQFKCPLGEKTKVYTDCPLNKNQQASAAASVKRIAHDLKEKYYHTFIHRYAEGKLEKKVRYICLTEGLMKGEIVRLQQLLESQMPLKKLSNDVFVKPIIAGLAVVDSALWNQNKYLSRYGQCTTV